MNLAIHGLSGEVKEANSYYEDPFGCVGRFDFVMANPPFNVDGVDKSRLSKVSRVFSMPNSESSLPGSCWCARIDRQSREPDRDKRRQLVWEIERRLAEDNVRPVIFYARQATCRQPRVKGLTLMVNSIYNGPRFDDLWLED